LTASTSLGVSAGRFAQFGVFFASSDSTFVQVSPIYAPGSIPGSSIEGPLISGPLSARSAGFTNFSQ
jgi:hypothetical protein